MADLTNIGSQVGSWLSGSLLFFVILISIILVIAIISTIAILLRRRNKFNHFKCVIWEEDTFGQIHETYDNAGIFVDNKTGNKRLFLKRNNVGLTPDQIPYIELGKKKIIYLFKTGLKNFTFIHISLNKDKLTTKVGEEDVNWAINSYEKQKKIFQNNMFMQMLPFLMVAFVTLIILVIFIYFFKDFGTLRDMAVNMKEASSTMRDLTMLLRNNTVILPP